MGRRTELKGRRRRSPYSAPCQIDVDQPQAASFGATPGSDCRRRPLNCSSGIQAVEMVTADQVGLIRRRSKGPTFGRKRIAPPVLTKVDQPIREKYRIGQRRNVASPTRKHAILCARKFVDGAELRRGSAGYSVRRAAWHRDMWDDGGHRTARRRSGRSCWPVGNFGPECQHSGIVYRCYSRKSLCRDRKSQLLRHDRTFAYRRPAVVRVGSIRLRLTCSVDISMPARASPIGRTHRPASLA